MSPSRTIAITALLLMGATSTFAQDHVLHEFKKIQITKTFYCEGASFGDLNKDGKNDIASGPYWYEGPDYKTKHEIYEPKAFEPKKYSKNFLNWVSDINGDGWPDYIVGGFPGAESWWFENPKGKEGRWTRHVIIKVTDNESPYFADITGDGKPELVCSSGGFFGYAEPQADPTKLWTWTQISGKIAGGRFTHGLGIGDVNGDKRMDLLFAKGWLEQPKAKTASGQWKFHKTGFGKGGSNMFAYDVDGDGDNDIITCIHAHQYGLSWFEQTEPGKFTEHRFMDKDPKANRYGVAFSQMHSMDLVDMDGDGLKDIVTGKRWWAHGGRDPGGNDPAVVYWFKTHPQR